MRFKLTLSQRRITILVLYTFPPVRGVITILLKSTTYDLVEITSFERKPIRSVKIPVPLRESGIVRSRAAVKFFIGNEPGDPVVPWSHGTKVMNYPVYNGGDQAGRPVREETAVAIALGERYQSRAGIAHRIDHSRTRRRGRSNVPIDRSPWTIVARVGRRGRASFRYRAQFRPCVPPRGL